MSGFKIFLKKFFRAKAEKAKLEYMANDEKDKKIMEIFAQAEKKLEALRRERLLIVKKYQKRIDEIKQDALRKKI